GGRMVGAVERASHRRRARTHLGDLRRRRPSAASRQYSAGLERGGDSASLHRGCERHSPGTSRRETGAASSPTCQRPSGSSGRNSTSSNLGPNSFIGPSIRHPAETGGAVLPQLEKEKAFLPLR